VFVGCGYAPSKMGHDFQMETMPWRPYWPKENSRNMRGKPTRAARMR